MGTMRLHSNGNLDILHLEEIVILKSKLMVKED